jgi:predicted membrane-bound spermidine synthase
MKSEYAVLGILLIGLIVSIVSKSYVGVAIAALGIPLYLAYISREINILAKSRIFDRDLFLMIGITVFIILLFEYLLDPRIGLIIAAFVIPLLILAWDRLKTRK